MNKGRIIFLNGVPSSGKTSIVEALQNRDDCYFYVVTNDLFEQMIGDRFLQEDYWQHLSRVILLMYHTAKLFSDMGHDVLIDGILEPSYPSSTTLLVLCVLPTAVLQLQRRIPSPALRRFVCACLSVLALFMLAARLLSGVHWLTDILAGVLLSGALVTAYSACLAAR